MIKLGKRKLSQCPKCGGSMFVDSDVYGWYEKCINCGYHQELNIIDEYTEKRTEKIN